MINEAMLKAWALEAGFKDCALCDPYVFEAERAMVEAQPKLKERGQLRFDPLADAPQTKSLAVLLWPYDQADYPNDGSVFVDSYYSASNRAYHAARALEKRLTDAGIFAKANVSYPAKSAAIRAGLGFVARNGLLFTEAYGTRVVIILMATGVACESSMHECTAKDCIACGRCYRACPSGALTKEGMTYPERCLRNYMMEGVVVPPALRNQMGMRLIGCDMCQRVCPMQPVSDRKSQESFTLEEFMTEDASAFSLAVTRLGEEIGRNAARPQRVRAQAALLAGNAGSEAFLPVLNQWTESEFEAVKEHALWAIQRIRAAKNLNDGLDLNDKTI